MTHQNKMYWLPENQKKRVTLTYATNVLYSLIIWGGARLISTKEFINKNVPTKICGCH
jgi:hypothetical protein